MRRPTLPQTIPQPQLFRHGQTRTWQRTRRGAGIFCCSVCARPASASVPALRGRRPQLATKCRVVDGPGPTHCSHTRGPGAAIRIAVRRAPSTRAAGACRAGNAALRAGEILRPLYFRPARRPCATGKTLLLPRRLSPARSDANHYAPVKLFFHRHHSRGDQLCPAVHNGHQQPLAGGAQIPRVGVAWLAFR